MDLSKRSRVSWRGYIPAITTPFIDENQLDEKGLGLLLEWLVDQGMHGLVLAGTTGEWTAMRPEERMRLFTLAGQQVGRKVPLIAGCTSFTARESIAYARHAKDAGCDGILLTPTPYVRPQADEIVAFYEEVGAAIDLPICVYNWPPGTGIDMDPALLARLAEIDAVVAIKQSTPDFTRFAETFFALKDKVRVFGFPMNELGLSLLRVHEGDGTMGAGGVLGRNQSGFYDKLWAGDIEGARACGLKDRVLMRDWYTPDLIGRFGSGPAILKAALDAMGLPGGPVRGPLRPVGGADRERIAETLRNLDML
ncbi:dihydrodipicolinate synthase family protein [Novosphingobium profundi]|uniref:dihydrodipicolinate synthase family protein n=1 Tax=Novosphingobium profundi TaxID=1774954 RepID=UPI001BDB081E|nr:dihydrodipicolinate synthase family protein [Novosphingobium profundi]MBT0670725.1 dihydrodipicolinate synthase family protein [Novosphingobium profundi]